MSDWQKVKIGGFLEESRVESFTPNPENRIKVRLNVKGVEKRQIKNSVKGATKYYLRKSGQFIYGKQNLFKGAFGVVPGSLDGFETSADLPCFDIDETICLPEWLVYFLKQGKYYKELEKIARGAGSRRISPKDFYKIEIPLPLIHDQKNILTKIKSYETIGGSLSIQISHQQELLKKLRKAILQVAIEGKITKQWRKKNPDIEPASVLLEKIKAEKTRLVTEKKLKKAKSIPPIEKDEIPFEVPESWVWCRLGEYALFERGRFSVRPRNDPSYYGGVYPFIQIGSLDSEGSLVNKSIQTLNERGLSVSKMFEKGSIVIAIVGGTIGNMGVLGLDMCFPDSMVGVRPKQETCQDYILILLKHFHPLIRELSYQMAGQPNIKLPTLNNLKFALPPLAEQKEIVKKFDHLFTICNDLEGQIHDSKTNTEILMQAVLKEAFEH